MASAVQHPCKVQIDLTVFFSYKKIIEPYFLFYFLQLGFKWNICHVTVRIDAEYIMTVFTMNLYYVLT